MDQAGMLAALLEDLADAVFLAEGFGAADALDLQAVLSGDPLSIGPDLIAHRLTEVG